MNSFVKTPHKPIATVTRSHSTGSLFNAFVNARGQGGNPCQLFIYQQRPEKIEPATKAITNCYCWPQLNKDQQQLAVQCCNQQGLIQCCGHGLLSAAYWWLQNQPGPSITLMMNDSEIVAHQHNNRIWLRFTRLAIQQCEVPAWVDLFFQDPPITAATAGGEQGYFILQWPDNYPLQHLQAPGNSLKAHSQRALIITSATNLLADTDILYRYFAPQYGNYEDSATGSAMRVLASFWQQRFTHISALQCSPATGRLNSRIIDDEHIEVGGYCQPGGEL